MRSMLGKSITGLRRVMLLSRGKVRCSLDPLVI
jgi:hypothetical protein